MKKWMTCIALGLLTITALGCQAGDPPTSNSTEVTAPPQGEQKQVAPEETPQELSTEARTYQNSLDGYLLDLPKEWAKVHIIEASRSTDFLYPSANPEYHQSLMRIVGMTNQEWEKVKAEGGPGVSQLKEITEIDGSKYFYVLPLDQVLEGQELEEYNAMAKQIPDILFNFRVETK
ncbi:hypothetical protein [Ammoniphilus sp. CFH 90114]|uniref:hypothetical protein n=1 Tax=Ammoniphilus sp. CFH 90114 TaxID=2493665 RepID=UPI00100FFE4B|nr:hypothetical protein [Ammoniphilus sp. CFH 90114]RXT07197.1 hypothetical protein EIZ39_13720 [Ammoniphilus sp. CFH 90114]